MDGPSARAARPIRVLGIAGSLRARSYNRALLGAARELAPEGMEIRIFEGLGRLPLYDADLEAQGEPEPVAALKTAIGEADALLIATPEYNYGVPGVLKNAVEWASRPATPGSRSVLYRKPAAIIGASVGTTGTARAQLALRQSFVYTETYALLRPEVLVARAQDKIDAEGHLMDAETRKTLRQLLEALVDWTRRLGPS